MFQYLLLVNVIDNFSKNLGETVLEFYSDTDMW